MLQNPPHPSQLTPHEKVQTIKAECPQRQVGTDIKEKIGGEMVSRPEGPQVQPSRRGPRPPAGLWARAAPRWLSDLEKQVWLEKDQEFCSSRDRLGSRPAPPQFNSRSPRGQRSSVPLPTEMPWGQNAPSGWWGGRGLAQAGVHRAQPEGGAIALMFSDFFFFFKPELSVITYTPRGKEKQARFFGSLNVILLWPRQCCQSNKRGLMLSLSPLHPGNEFLK